MLSHAAIEKLTVAKLKVELKKHDLETKGLKVRSMFRTKMRIHQPADIYTSTNYFVQAVLIKRLKDFVDEQSIPGGTGEVDAANEVDEAKAKKAADELKAKKQADDAKAKQEADDAKAKQEADDAKAKQESDDAKAKQEADEVEAKQEADEVEAKKEADEVKAKEEADEAKAKKKAQVAKKNAAPTSIADIIMGDDELESAEKAAQNNKKDELARLRAAALKSTSKRKLEAATPVEKVRGAEYIVCLAYARPDSIQFCCQSAREPTKAHQQARRMKQRQTRHTKRSPHQRPPPRAR
jgi:colicin import membrane protein